MKILTATKEDVKKISNLWLIFIQDPDGSDLNIIPSEDNRKRWMNFVESLMDSDSGSLKFAVENFNPVGYIFYSWHITPLETKKKAGTIYDLFVLKEYRGRGIGTELMKSAIEDLKNHGVDIVRLNVLSKNIRAIGLYEKFGFKEVLKTMYLYLD